MPLRDAQNRFNSNVVQVLTQMEAYSLEQKEYAKEQEKRLEMQEEDIEKLTQRLQILEKKYEALLDEKTEREIYETESMLCCTEIWVRS